MKHIFIEGIQGMGKSTLLQAIATKYPKYQVCREGDYSPVELAWCAWLTEGEYEEVLKRYDAIREEIVKNTVVELFYKDMLNETYCEECNPEMGARTENVCSAKARHYVVCYTKILTDIPGFHKDLERYEIYNGRKSFDEMQEIILSRYQKFFQGLSKQFNEVFHEIGKAAPENYEENGYLFECSFLQNIVEDLILFHQLDDDEIVEFYKKLYENVDKDKFLLLYLYAENLEESTSIIKKERSDGLGNEMWYPLMLEYLVNSPYGKAHGYKDFDDMVAHFRHRQRLELRILKEVVGEHVVVIPAKKWDEEFLEAMIARI